jgi:hypothetical protein
LQSDASAAACLSFAFAVRAKPSPGFKNVDLEIVSRSRLDAIETAVSDTAHALYSGPLRKGIFLLSLECNVYPKDADAAIIRLCAAVDRFSKSERRIWERALRRTFDVGYDVAPGGTVHVALQPETIKRAAALGAMVAFTCYSGDESEQDGPANGSQPIRSETNSTSSAVGSRR